MVLVCLRSLIARGGVRGDSQLDDIPDSLDIVAVTPVKEYGHKFSLIKVINTTTRSSQSILSVGR
jgi:hypothetical protein